MPQFTSPRPSAAIQLRKPRNPLVAPAQFRQAGRHQPLKARQQQTQSLRLEMRELWRPPSTD